MPQNRRFPYADVLTVALGHLIQDGFSAFYPILLPRIAPVLGLSRGAAGLLEFVRQMPSAFNPVWGYWTDRYSLYLVAALAPGITATGMTLVGLAPNLPTLTVLLFVVGISTAWFHASMPALVAHVSQPYAGRGMSFFMAAGELARTLGPLLAVWGVTTLGFGGLPSLALLGWSASAVLVARLLRGLNHVAQPVRYAFWTVLRGWGARYALPLAVVIFGRSFLVGVLGTYLAWYLTDQGLPWTRAGVWVALYEALGVVGALAAGTLSDRLGRRRMIVAGTVLAAAALVVMVRVPLAWKPWLLPVMGLGALSVQPVMLALVQDTTHTYRAMINGVYMGMSFVIRPMGVSLIGGMVDLWGWTPVLTLGAVLAVLSLLALTALPVSDAPKPLEETG